MFRKHLRTVLTHRKAVRKLCFKCGLYKQGLLHDMSKFSPTEFIPGVKYWTGNRSPIDNQIDDIGYSEAWLHHKGRNKHHYEYWVDQTHGTPNLICDMPLRYIAEMFCDRVGASKAYLGDKYTNDAPLKYAQSKEERERQLMSTTTYNQLIEWFEDLAQHGEDYVCRKIKQALNASPRK